MSSEYQWAPLRMVFDIKKVDLHYKAWFIVGGYRIDTSHLEAYSLVVESISLRILLTMAKENNLKIISEDAENAFLYISVIEKVYTIAGEEFGEY